MTAGYAYKAYDASGAVVSGEVTAADRNDALAKIRSLGLIPFHAAPAGAETLFTKTIRRAPPRLSRKAATEFHRQLASLLSAGLRIDQALGILERLLSARRDSAVVTRLRASVREGRPLSAAMEAFPDSFERFEVALIRNGERRGDIAAAADMTAGLLERSLAVRGRVISALIYPAILTAAAIGALLIVTLVLAPTILPMYERSGQAPPPAFAMLIAVSDLLRRWWWLILLLLAAGGAWIARAARSPQGQAAIDRSILAAPLIGRAAALGEAARLTRTLAALLKAGAPLPDALAEAAGVLKNSIFRDHFLAARDRIRRGESFSGAVAGLAQFPATILDFIVIGEHTGRLSEMLAHAASYADATATRMIDRATSALSPMLTLVMGLLVGSLIAVVLSAILGANELLTG